MKNITVHFSDDREAVEKSFKENLYDYPWNQYRKIEQQIQAYASLNRDGEIQSLDIDKDDMGEMIVNVQNKLAEVVLNQHGIGLDEVTAETVKNIVSSYGDDMEKLGLKLKKKKEG